jgi:hypothetical protein
MLGSKRSTHSLIGPKISLATVVVVAGVIGISGIGPQVIDAGWMQDSPAHPPKMSVSTPTAKRSGVVAAIPLPPPRALALAAGEATAFSPRPVVAPLAATGTPLGVAEVPDAQAQTNTVPPKPALAGAAKSADKSRTALVARKVVGVQKKAAQVERRQRSHSGTYVQNGGGGLARRWLDRLLAIRHFALVLKTHQHGHRSYDLADIELMAEPKREASRG